MCISYKVIMNLKNDKKQKKTCLKKLKMNTEKHPKIFRWETIIELKQGVHWSIW